MRNEPGPNAAEASTTPVVSHAPQFPGLIGNAGGVNGGLSAGSTSVGPPSADWLIFATICGEPENGTYQSSRGCGSGIGCCRPA